MAVFSSDSCACLCNIRLPLCIPCAYHAQGLIFKRFLELKDTNKIYERHGGRDKKFFSYPKVQTLLHLPPPRPIQRVGRVLLFPHAKQPGHENDS